MLFQEWIQVCVYYFSEWILNSCIASNTGIEYFSAHGWLHNDGMLLTLIKYILFTFEVFCWQIPLIKT